MNKNDLIFLIEKYNLNGLCDSVKWVVKDKKINISFINEDKHLIGLLNGNIDIDRDVVLSICNTSQLLKILKILENDISLDISYEGNIATSLLIKDRTYTSDFRLTSEYVIPRVPKIKEVTYDMEIDFKPFIDIFIKAYKSIKPENFSINPNHNFIDKDYLEFSIGDIDGFSNSIKFDIETGNQNGFSGLIVGNYFYEMINTNQNCDSLILKICNDGMLGLSCVYNNLIVDYNLICKKHE